jgi:endo-1,4-beta-xylanase
MKNNLFFKKETKILSQGIIRGVLSLSVASLLLFASCSKDEVNAEAPIEQNKTSINPASTARFGDRFNANRTGSSNGYFYSIDKDGASGSAFIDFDGQYGNPANRTQVTKPGNFSMTWKDVKQMVGGIGWSGGSGRTINYNVGTVSGQYKFVGVYGWTKNPLTEYYVCERGSGSLYSKGKVGTATTTASYVSNGHTYRVYRNRRVNSPSITGTATFWQFESLWGGAATGTSYTISMGTHFTNWNRLLNNVQNPALNTFGTTTGGGYMLFGCEGYDYSSATSGVSGSLNATIW